jgi:hypothetical protein
MNERLPCRDVRKMASLARKTFQCQKRLLSETDQLLRSSRDLISRTRVLIRQTQHLNGSADVSTTTTSKIERIRPWVLGTADRKKGARGERASTVTSCQATATSNRHAANS